MVAVREIHVEHIANFGMLRRENESQYVLRSSDLSFVARMVSTKGKNYQNRLNKQKGSWINYVESFYCKC